ncbi:ubiquitin-conjugating enzyme E2 [Ceratobasidium sp. AG-Ba]|nr:ubiquitin-conjugating enzyme E2 [Ceratobasidium sp. AG-Ba]QRW03821.1 ubiquitin-conjugating enzyme E2 [Ceratobasidium sp. AG-Ba]
MTTSISPLAAFRDLLALNFSSAGMKTPVHTILVSAIVNTMSLLSIYGTQARFRGTGIVSDVLFVSEQVTMLSVCLNINVKFRFNDIFELPMDLITDGHIVGFDSFNIYFKNRRVSPEELHRAQTLFNFVSIVRHLSGLLGDEGILELVEDFKKPATLVASTLPNRKVARSRSRRNGLSRVLSRPYERRPLSNQNPNTMAINNTAQPEVKLNNAPKQHNRSKRHARIWNENALLAPESSRRERNTRTAVAGFH